MAARPRGLWAAVKAAELDKGDNLRLVQSAKAIIDGFAQLHEKELIGAHELVDLACRFAGELVDMEQVLGRGVGLCS